MKYEIAVVTLEGGLTKLTTEADFVEVNDQRIARLGAFNVERAGQHIVGVDDQLAVLVVAPRVE